LTWCAAQAHDPRGALFLTKTFDPLGVEAIQRGRAVAGLAIRACQLGDFRRSTLPFGDGNDPLIFAPTVTKTAAPQGAALKKETRERRMAKAPPSAKRDRIKAFTPALVDYTNDVVYGDLWERKALSKRDRSLITVAALVATYRPEQLVSHLSRAIANGVTQEEITEVITHMAFYAGWPAAMSAAQVAYTVLVEGNKGE
jgi:4-carboxymuconolactone decarboxylase